MRFALLHGTCRRQYVGDVLINTHYITGFKMKLVDKKDEKFYVVAVDMMDDSCYKALFNTLDEARAMMKELVHGSENHSMIDEFLPSLPDEDDIKKEQAVDALKALLS